MPKRRPSRVDRIEKIIKNNDGKELSVEDFSRYLGKNGYYKEIACLLRIYFPYLERKKIGNVVYYLCKIKNNSRKNLNQ